MTAIAIIGVGKIVHAFLEGLQKSSDSDKFRITLVGKNPSRNAELSQQWNLPSLGLEEAVDQADYVILAVKPKDLTQVLNRITHLKSVFISFMGGGISTGSIESQLAPIGQAHVIRAMTNTPMAINHGLIGISPGKFVTDQELAGAISLLSQTGKVFTIPESLQPAFGALAGCGPAFIYLIAEALTDAAVAQGLPRDLASQLSGLLMQGSAGMLLENPDQAAKLRAEVTSPGGSTAIGVQKLEENGVRAAFYQALEAICTKVSS